MPEHGELRIRNVPEHVRRQFHAQAVARGMTMARYVAHLVSLVEAAENIEAHPEKYAATPFAEKSWEPAVKL